MLERLDFSRGIAGAGKSAPVFLLFFVMIFTLILLTTAATPAGKQSAPTTAGRYLSPIEMALSPDGRTLYVVCEASDELRAVDLQSSRVVSVVSLGRVPRGIVLSRDGRQIFVTNAWSDTVSVIDGTTLKLVSTLPTGFEPTGIVLDRTGGTLYVANRLSSDISVIDVNTGHEIKRLLAGRGASYLALSTDGKFVYGTHIYPNAGAFRTPPSSEITVIDTARQTVVERKQLHNVAGVFHLAISADGRLGVAAELRPKNLVPLAHVEHGWVFGDSLTFFGADVGATVQVPIDELDRYYALPWGVAITPDKSKIFVTTAGSENVIVIDVSKLLAFARTPTRPFVNDLSAAANYVSARIPVGHNPRGALLSQDGTRLYVANRLDDNISVIDTSAEKVVSTIDGLQWDLEPDGFGKDIVDNRSLENLAGTEPFKWNGGNPDMPTECGPRTEKFFYRSQSYSPQELTDLVTFVYSLPFRPNRYRLANGELTPSQERGKALFERTKYKNGQQIPENKQCAYCHSGPKYTNQRQFDVGTGKSTDRSPVIDVPQLNNVAYSAPYLHDGSARSLEEIWTVFNPKDMHGVSNDLTKDELNDLIEYLKTL